MADKYIYNNAGKFKEREATVVSTGVAEAGDIVALDATGLIDPSLLPPIGSGTFTSVDMTVPTGLSISGNPVTTIGTLALTYSAGYAIPTTVKQGEWDTAYTNRITSLTTTGTSGAATLIANTLNIPNYTDTYTGTVETVSITTANGFAGLSDGDPTDPYITLSTTVTGMVKGNGTALSAAVGNTDYQEPISLTTTGSSGAATFIGNVLNVPNYTGTVLGSGTTNELTYWVNNTTLGALAVATYPSLTEVSYVKGATSSIQTQLNGKANLALSNLASVAINTSLISDTDNTDDLGSAAIAWKDVYLRTIKMDGSASGTITLQAQAAAGTYNFNLPTTAGTSGYLLTSAGGVGSPMTWLNPATIPGTFALSNGSGTTAAGTAVDWNGPLTTSAILDLGGNTVQLGIDSRNGLVLGVDEHVSELGDWGGVGNSTKVRVDDGNSLITLSVPSGSLLINDTSLGSATNGYIWTLTDNSTGAGQWLAGAPMVPTLTEYRLAVGDASNLLSDAAAITADRALISDANGVPTHSTTTATQLSYVDATSSIQTQLNAKVGALAAVGSSPNANGATITGSTLTLQPASASFGGVIDTIQQTFTGLKILTTGFQGGSTNTNLYIPDFNSNNTEAGANTLRLHAVNTQIRVGVGRGSSGSLVPIGYNYVGTMIGQSAASINTSGTHDIFANMAVKAPAIGANTGTLTNSASLYIEGQASGATNNYALLVKAGLAAFDGTVKLGTASTAGYVWTATDTIGNGGWAASPSGFSDPMTTRGDIIIRDAANTTARLGIGANTYVLTSDGTDISWAAPTGGSGLTVGTTTITSGTNTRVLYNNSGVLGEYTVTGTGTELVKSVSPTITGSLDVTGTPAGAAALLTVTAGGGFYPAQFFNVAGDAYVSIGQSQSVTNTGVIHFGYVGINSTSNYLGLGFPSSFDLFKLTATGALQASEYGTGAITGTATYGAAFDTSGNIIEVALSTGNVTKVGTPVNNQIGVWTGDGTIEGDAGLVWDTTKKALGFNAITLSPWASQSGIIEGGGASIFFGTVSDMWLSSNAYFDSSWKYKANGKAANIGVYDGEVWIRAQGTGVQDAAFSFLMPFKAYSNGSDGFVGLGGNITTTSGSLTGAIVQVSSTIVTSAVDITVPDEAYDATGWNGSLEVPTKNAIRDKIESMGAGGGITRIVTVTSGSATMGSTALTDYVYFVSGAHTMSLPAAAGNTNRYTVKNNHSVAITVDTVGAENVEGVASISIAAGDSTDLISDGTNWWVI